jgi:hypothetical protein
MFLYVKFLGVKSIHVHAHQDSPQKVRALVLFLSPASGPDRDEAFKKLSEPGFRLTKEGLSQLGKFSWRMPLEAIAYHLERLSYIYVIPSSDSVNAKGTHLDFSDFIKILDRLLENHDLCLSDDYKAGVDFENAQQLIECIESIYKNLHEKDIPDYDILVDITGGQKVPTVAGAAVALAEGRRFQYVSTRDYKVIAYDITYLPDS